jgi:hypothetical protein
LGQVAGVVLLVAGLALGGWGAPYYMLDWGSTLVISGAVLASAGLLAVLIGTALIRLASLRDELRGLRAQAAVDAALAPAAATLAPAPSAPPFEGATVAVTDRTEAEALWPQREPPAAVGVRVAPVQPRGAEPAALGLAGAGAGMAAAAVALSGVLRPRTDEAAQDAVAPPAITEAEAPPAVAPPSPLDVWAASAPAAPELDREGLDALVSDALTAEFGPAEPAAPDEAGDEPDAPQGEAAHADEPPWPAAAPWPEPLPDPLPEPLPPPTREELFARVEHAVRGIAPAAAADDYDDLRADLAGLGREAADSEPLAPERHAPDPHAHDPFAPEPFASDQPAGDPGRDATLDDAFDVDTPADATTGEAVEGLAAAPVEATMAETEEPAAPSDSAPAPPTASEEGVVAAYTVGDSAYAMLADGRIRVTTPEEEQYFNSMDELKDYMLRRRAEGLSI